jgi:hypothetical protein
MENLTPAQTETITRMIGSWKFTEIAARVGCSLQTVKDYAPTAFQKKAEERAIQWRAEAERAQKERHEREQAEQRRAEEELSTVLNRISEGLAEDACARRRFAALPKYLQKHFATLGPESDTGEEIVSTLLTIRHYSNVAPADVCVHVDLAQGSSWREVKATVQANAAIKQAEEQKRHEEASRTVWTLARFFDSGRYGWYLTSDGKEVLRRVRAGKPLLDAVREMQ